MAAATTIHTQQMHCLCRPTFVFSLWPPDTVIQRFGDQWHADDGQWTTSGVDSPPISVSVVAMNLGVAYGLRVPDVVDAFK